MASPAAVAIVIDGGDAQDAPVRWAAGHLRSVLLENGHVVAEAGAGIRRVQVSRVGRIDGAVQLPEGEDAFAIVPDSSGIVVCGRSVRALVYALTELAERVRTARAGDDPLAFASPQIESPSSGIRSVCRFFCSEEEDKHWLYDRQMWEDYLTMLVTHRFTRISLGFGLQYNYPYYNRLITDVYLYFAYPFLVSVPGYDVRVAGLSDAERERNLETLRFIGRAAAERGLEFHIALWTHGYDFDDVPNANYRISGITPDNHAAYCRDALAALVTAVPDLTGVTVRVHVEGGIPEGSYAFWETVLGALSTTGRAISLDIHAKGTDQRIIDIGIRTGLPVTVSPKFMAEHTGLPYHQASVRHREMPSDEAVGKIFALSEGSRRFLRYGYGDLFASERNYDVLVRVWPGTQRVLLSADPALAAGYGRAAAFCGAQGIEFCEPLSFKGRMGSGRLGQRFNYRSEELRTRYDFSKYEYMYLLLGRLAFDPNAPRESWMRHLRHVAGEAAEACEAALASASRILPLFTLAHGVSACNNTYWPEIYDNMSIVYPPTHYPYSYDSGATRFGDVPTFDPQLFASPAESVGALWEGKPLAKYTAMDVAVWLETCVGQSRAAIRAAQAVDAASRPAVRRLLIDAESQAGLGAFFAARIRSACAFELYLLSGEQGTYDDAMAYYRRAREAWIAIVKLTEDVYQDDLSYGPQPWLRGAWKDRLPAIDRDIEDLAFWYINDRARPLIRSDDARALLAAMRTWQARPSAAADGDLPQRFARGEPLAIRLAAKSNAASDVRLFYRPVNQALTWSSVAMSRENGAFTATIPPSATDGRYPLQYYFAGEGEQGTVFIPGLGDDLCRQPYFVAMPA